MIRNSKLKAPGPLALKVGGPLLVVLAALTAVASIAPFTPAVMMFFLLIPAAFYLAAAGQKIWPLVVVAICWLGFMGSPMTLESIGADQEKHTNFLTLGLLFWMICGTCAVLGMVLVRTLKKSEPAAEDQFG